MENTDSDAILSLVTMETDLITKHHPESQAQGRVGHKQNQP
jgi:hypothetical protein